MARSRKTPPSMTIEGREAELVSLAVDEAEKRLLSGTATSQLICELLKRSTIKYQLELEKIRADVKVAGAKVSQMESQQRSEEIAREAIEAMKRYSGYVDDEEEEDY